MEKAYAFVETFMQQRDIELIYAEDSPAFWVDWREFDEDIADYCHIDGLTAEVCDADNDLGYDLFFSYKDRKTQVLFEEEDITRDPALQAINRVIMPDYELRFMTDTLGGDGLAFIVLEGQGWQTLTAKYGKDALDSRFLPITDGTTMFGLSFDEVMQSINA